jgi:Fic family protein
MMQKVKMGASPGRYQLSPQGHRLFYPDLLPPHFDVDPTVAAGIEEATHLLGQVEMCRTLLPNPGLLVYGSLRREALASSTIEGTIASPEELLLFQAVQRPDREAVREVANYATALEWGCEQLADLPISTRLILGLHERLLRGVRGAGTAGRFKDAQNFIALRSDAQIEEAVFVPPPPDRVAELMSDLEHYINLDTAGPRILRCAVAHYQFETIHPFGDGNGRVGRLLIILHLIQLRLLSQPLIHPSVFLERTRDQYYQLLQDVRDSGAWNQWVGYFAGGMAEQARETIEFAQTTLRLRQEVRERVSNVRRRASVAAVVDAFFHEPVLSITEISKRVGLAYNSVAGALKVLKEHRIVAEISDSRKRRVWACTPLLRVLFSGMPGDGWTG